MKIQPLPITNLKLQPPGLSAPSLRGSLPLQELQNADVFFSSQSIRAHLSEVLANKPGVTDPLVKMLTFTAPSSPWVPFSTKNSSALIIEKRAIPKEDTVLTESPKDLKTEAPLEKAPHLKAQWVDYRTTFNFKPDLLLRVYQLPFAKPTEQPRFIENRVAYIEKTGALLSGLQIQQAGIVETYRPRLEKFLQGLNRYLPQSKFFKQFLDIAQNGAIRLFNRWEFNGVRSYRDAVGNRVQFYDMARLPNNMIVQVEKKEVLAESTLEVASKKAFKDAVLASIEKAEGAGYHLLQENAPSGVVQPAPVVDKAKPALPVSNPFMTNPFTVKPTNSFMPTKVADVPPAEA